MTQDLAPVSVVLESLAAHVAQHSPDRLLSSLEEGALVGRTDVREPSRMRVEQLSHDGARVRLRVLTDAGPIVTATAVLCDARLPPPMGGAGWTARLGGANGSALYALDVASPVVGRPMRNVLRVVRQLRPASLDAELEYPSGSDAALVGHSGPVAIEGMLQLARWTWFAIAGDRTRLEGFERLTWYRLPRPGELLRLSSTLKGTRAELPCLDVQARSVSGEMLLQLQGLRLLPVDVHGRASRPTSQWQRFLSLVAREEMRAEIA